MLVPARCSRVCSGDPRFLPYKERTSVKVDLLLEEREAPETLYHGTVERSLPSSQKVGLVRCKRHHAISPGTWRLPSRSGPGGVVTCMDLPPGNSDEFGRTPVVDDRDGACSQVGFSMVYYNPRRTTAAGISTAGPDHQSRHRERTRRGRTGRFECP